MPADRSPQHPDVIRVHRGSVTGNDRRLVGGVPVTSPARTIIDMAGVLEGEALEVGARVGAAPRADHCRCARTEAGGARREGSERERPVAAAAPRSRSGAARVAARGQGMAARCDRPGFAPSGSTRSPAVGSAIASTSRGRGSRLRWKRMAFGPTAVASRTSSDHRRLGSPRRRRVADRAGDVGGLRCSSRSASSTECAPLLLR